MERNVEVSIVFNLAELASPGEVCHLLTAFLHLKIKNCPCERLLPHSATFSNRFGGAPLVISPAPPTPGLATYLAVFKKKKEKKVCTND